MAIYKRTNFHFGTSKSVSVYENCVTDHLKSDILKEGLQNFTEAKICVKNHNYSWCKLLHQCVQMKLLWNLTLMSSSELLLKIFWECIALTSCILKGWIESLLPWAIHCVSVFNYSTWTQHPLSSSQGVIFLVLCKINNELFFLLSQRSCLRFQICCLLVACWC